MGKRNQRNVWWGRALAAWVGLAMGCGDSANPGADSAAEDAGLDAGGPAEGCAPRELSGDGRIHFHHIHFNTGVPDADQAFFEDMLDAPAIDYCTDRRSGAVTRATRTERAYFFYTKVDPTPDRALNTYLEHIGWVHPSPADEMKRLGELGASFWPTPDHYQCAEAVAGEAPCVIGMTDYFYLITPGNVRVEVAQGPGPASSGFGHLHVVTGTDFGFFERVTDGAFADGSIDDVNMIDSFINPFLLDGDDAPLDTRGRPVDHLAYSTTKLEEQRTRLEGLGIAIEEDISFKPEYGFRSFFVRSPEGIWVELVEDSPFDASAAP